MTGKYVLRVRVPGRRRTLLEATREEVRRYIAGDVAAMKRESRGKPSDSRRDVEVSREAADPATLEK